MRSTTTLRSVDCVAASALLGELNRSCVAGEGDVRALRVPRSEWQRSLTDAVRGAFAHHFQRNGFYRAQCYAAQIQPADIGDYPDLHRIPLLPVGMFKQTGAHVLLTSGLADVEIEIRSTRTSGVPSVARRDALTVTRASVGLFGCYRDFFGISKGAGLFLCPSIAEVPEMGMVKVFNLLTGMLDDHRYVVRDYSFDPEEALACLRNWEGKMTRHIVGPPFIVARLMRFLELEAIPLTLDPESLIIMLGGWKQYTGRSISRDEFNHKAGAVLGIDRMPSVVRMSESFLSASGRICASSDWDICSRTTTCCVRSPVSRMWRCHFAIRASANPSRWPGPMSCSRR